MRFEPELTREAHRAQIARLAKEAFADHVLTQESPNSWYAGKPGTGFYSFRVLTVPGYVVLLGDVGDLVLRASDRDSLGWLRGSTDIDYVLSKTTACREEEIFLLQEAKDYAKEREEEQPEDRLLWRRVIVELKERLEWQCPRDAWVNAWCEIFGDCDAPRCTDWAPQLLWQYHALRTFCRLLREAERRTA